MQISTTLTLSIAFWAAIMPVQARTEELPPPEWKQLVACIKADQMEMKNCPVETFDAEADDPTDRARRWRRVIEPIFRRDPLQDQSEAENVILSIARGNGVVFQCGSSSVGPRKCASARKMPPSQAKERDLRLPSESEVNFLYFYPPYSDRKIDGAMKLNGSEAYCSVIRREHPTECESIATSVDDYWLRWVDLSSVDGTLRQRTAQLFRELIKPSKPCNAEGLPLVGHLFKIEKCNAITLLVNQDGFGVISDCSRRIAQQLGPPIKDSCQGLVAFDDQHIWVPAFVRAASHEVTGCLRNTMGNCGLAMGFRFDFAEKEAGEQYRQKNKTFVNSMINELKNHLGQPPWNISDIAFDSNLAQYTGVSTKRRSQIVGDYEDLSIYLSISGSKRPDDPFHSDHSSEFQIRLSKGEARELRIVMEIEIYVSKYNSADSAYWIKPSVEQEARYRAALAKVFADSAAASCATRQLKASLDDSTHAHCD